MNLENEMRSWLKECFEDEYDHEQIDELSSVKLIDAIERYYAGGFAEFVKCSGWNVIEG